MSRTLAVAVRQLDGLGRGGLQRVIAIAAKTSALEGERIAKVETYPASGLHVRSGRLRASIAGASREGADGTEIVLSAGGSRAGRDVSYAGVHEGVRPDGSRVTSTVIRPKSGRYLRIPTLFAMTAAGVDRNPGPLRQTAPGRFRFVKTNSGGVLVPTETGKGGRMQPPWYTLVSQVTIPARPYLRPALQRLRPIVAQRVEAGLRKALEGDNA